MGYDRFLHIMGRPDDRPAVLAYCLRRGITVPRGYLRIRGRYERRFAVIRASMTPPRLVGQAYSDFGQVAQWVRLFGVQDPPPFSIAVVDIENEALLQLDAGGSVLGSTPIRDFLSGPTAASKAVLDARIRSDLEAAIANIWGAASLDARRKAIIEEVAQFDVELLDSSGGGRPLLRLSCCDFRDREQILGCLAELFDLELLDANPIFSVYRAVPRSGAPPPRP